MRLRQLTIALVVVLLALSITVACRRTEPPTSTKPAATESKTVPEQPTQVDDEPTATSEMPTAQPTPTTGPVDYDVALYGYLETLDPSGQMVIYWHQLADADEELMLGMIDEFNRTNEWRITVLAESLGNSDDLHERIMDSLPENQLPTMAAADQDRAATYAAQGALIPLDPYVESPSWGYSDTELDDFFPVSLAADILPQFGTRYGWPIGESMQVMYYNKDWLAKLGYANPPATFDEFAAVACAAAAQPFSDNLNAAPSYGYVYRANTSSLAPFIISHGGNLTNEDGSGYTFNGPAGLEALSLWQDLVAQGCAGEQTDIRGDDDFATGRTLLVTDSIRKLRDYSRAVKEGAAFAWSIAPLPHSTARPRMTVYGASQSIFRTTPEAQLASWLFIKWMNEPEQQAVWVKGTDFLPTRQSTADLLTDYFARHPSYEAAFALLSMDYGIEPPVAGYDQCRPIIDEMVNVVLKSGDVQSQLDMAAEVCNEYLKQAAP
jgi:ABC-type glycerol-3-phosphate transport system substrate-binding protein